MSMGCAACLDGEHKRCYNKTTCPCAIDWNHGLTKSGSVNDKGEIIFVNAKHSDDDRIDRVSKSLIEKYNFKTARESNTIYLFTGKIYENKKALAIIKEETEKRILECTERDCLEVIAKIKRKTYKNLEDFDSDPNVLTLPNGILNLQTMELSPHTPTNLSKVLIPCNYIEPFSKDIEENLKDTLFWKFLESSFTINGKVDEESIETVLEIMASVFIKKPIDERAFIMWGEGENGKSVLLDYISFMLGKDNISNIPLQELTADKFAAANLDGKHANIFSDLEKNEFKQTSKFRALASGEPVYAQFKRVQGFDLHPFSSLIFSTNRFPKVYGDNKQGFFRRWIIVKWLRNFENDPQRDSKLKQKLLQNTAERDIVFSNLIHISKRLYDSNKFSYSKNWKENQKVWNENADPVKNFIETYTLEVENHNESKRETHNFYKEICDELGETPLGMKQFSLAMSEYYDESKSQGTRTWNHMKLKRPVQETLQDSDSTESKSTGDT
jgi:P4 family phage/plasmid primase-like protien